MTAELGHEPGGRRARVRARGRSSTDGAQGARARGRAEALQEEMARARGGPPLGQAPRSCATSRRSRPPWRPCRCGCAGGAPERAAGSVRHVSQSWPPPWPRLPPPPWSSPGSKCTPAVVAGLVLAAAAAVVAGLGVALRPRSSAACAGWSCPRSSLAARCGGRGGGCGSGGRSAWRWASGLALAAGAALGEAGRARTTAARRAPAAAVISAGRRRRTRSAWLGCGGVWQASGSERRPPWRGTRQAPRTDVKGAENLARPGARPSTVAACQPASGVPWCSSSRTSDSILEPFSRALAREGFEPCTSPHARARRSAAARERAPDLVLLDLMLPDGDGRDVLPRAAPRTPSVPIIMLTARGTEIDRVVGLELGRRRLRGQAVQRRRGDRAHARGPAARASRAGADAPAPADRPSGR